MDETYPIKAIILKREPYREADARVVVYGREHGRLDLVARGTKKLKSKMAGHLEPISVSNIMVVRGRQFDYVGSAVSEDVFPGIKSDLEKIESAGKALNFFLSIIKEGIEDAVIFDLLLDFLNILNQPNDPIPSAFGHFPLPRGSKKQEYLLPLGKGETRQRRRGGQEAGLSADFFILKLMARLGYKPELRDCVICHQKIKPKGNKFNFSKGGIVCPECVKLQGGNGEIAISDDVIKIMRMAIEDDFDKLQKVRINDKLKIEIRSLIGSFKEYHN